jgi:hypothetical protein
VCSDFNPVVLLETGLRCSLLCNLAHGQPEMLCCCSSTLPCCRAVGTYTDVRTAIRERDLAVLAVHGRKERNPAAPTTLLPVSSYSEQEVAATAAELQQRVRGVERRKFILALAAARCARPRQSFSRLFKGCHDLRSCGISLASPRGQLSVKLAAAFSRHVPKTDVCYNPGS